MTRGAPQWSESPLVSRERRTARSIPCRGKRRKPPRNHVGPHLMNGAGPVCARTTRSILVVLERELELHQRGIDRPDRLHAMATEVVRGTLQMQPGGLERPDRRHDLRVWLLRDEGSRAGWIARLCGDERQDEDGSERGHGDHASEPGRHVASLLDA